MKMNLKHHVWVLAIAGSFSAAAFAADREIKVDDRLDASAETLTDMMKASDRGIPHDLLNKARCVVVVPGMKKPGLSSARSMAAGSQYAADPVARAGAPRPRCESKAEVSGFRLALRRRMLCCS